MEIVLIGLIIGFALLMYWEVQDRRHKRRNPLRAPTTFWSTEEPNPATAVSGDLWIEPISGRLSFWDAKKQKWIPAFPNHK